MLLAWERTQMKNAEGNALKKLFITPRKCCEIQFGPGFSTESERQRKNR